MVLQLCYCIKTKDQSVQRVNKLLNVAKMCPRLCVYRVTVIISIQVCNILTELRLSFMILNCDVLHRIEAEKTPPIEPNEPTNLRNRLLLYIANLAKKKCGEPTCYLCNYY